MGATPGTLQRGHLGIGHLAVAAAMLAMAVGASFGYVDLSLARMGLSGFAIGLNAAMPAVGWLIATPLMPWALRRVPPRLLVLGLLAVAALSVLCFPLTTSPLAWMGLRFLFGGACGMVFRLVEYWINARSPATVRTRNVGIYGTLFCVGAAVGAALLPVAGPYGWGPVVMMGGLVGVSGVLFATLRDGPPPIARLPRRPARLVQGVAVAALAAALVYGMLEAVPYTLLPVYAVRAGLAEDWAVWSTSAFLGGLVVGQIPLGILADRVGRLRVLGGCTAFAMAIGLLVPVSLDAAPVLLLVMAAWGGCLGGTYIVALALLADLFDGEDLAGANAAFGTFYAVGSLAGAPVYGAAMDLWTHGLMPIAAVSLLLLLAIIARQARRAGAGGT